MKYDNKVKDMFDDTDVSSNQSAVGNNGEAPANNPVALVENYEYLEKVLEMQRNFKAIDERQTELLSRIEHLSKKVDTYKNNIVVSLSEEDSAFLRELPNGISKAMNDSLTGIAEQINKAINQNATSTIQAVNSACDERIKIAKKELGAKKGIFLTWWNFWLMIAMTIYSVAYAVYAAFNRCLWGELWEILWLPFVTLLLLGGSLGLIFYLNYREIRLPKL